MKTHLQIPITPLVTQYRGSVPAVKPIAWAPPKYLKLESAVPDSVYVLWNPQIESFIAYTRTEATSGVYIKLKENTIGSLVAFSQHASVGSVHSFDICMDIRTLMELKRQC